MSTKVVIPTFNEAENIVKIIPAILALPIPDIGVLVVDDNSPDGTGDIVEGMKAQYPGKIDCLHRQGKLGLGTAYIAGFKWCIDKGYDFIVQMDADFSHPVEKLKELYETIPDYDVVIGSRYVKGGKLDETWPFWRKLLSGFGNFYARTILGIKVRDVTGGFKMWRREALAGLPLDRIKSNGYVFQVEMNYTASKLGYRIKEIPIYFAERKLGKSKMSFKVQSEAAVRTWKLLGLYRDLKPKKNA